MHSRIRIFSACSALAAGLVLVPIAAGDPAPAPAARGSWISRLAVRDLAGAPLILSGRSYVIVFLGQECPVSNAAIPTLNRLVAEFAPRGIAFIGAYVDPTADLGLLRAHASDYKLALAAADDRAHHLVRLAGATYTPEVAVFSAAGERLYLGRIDDRVGGPAAARPAAAREDLRLVLRAVADGAPGPFPGQPGYGCAIPEAVKP